MPKLFQHVLSYECPKCKTIASVTWWVEDLSRVRLCSGERCIVCGSHMIPMKWENIPDRDQKSGEEVMHVDGPDCCGDDPRHAFLLDYMEVLIAKLRQEQPCHILDIRLVTVPDLYGPKDNKIFFLRIDYKKHA